MRSLIRWTVGLIVVIHGLIHLMGVVKGFGWGDVSQLVEPISTSMGVAWLVAAVVVIAAGVMLLATGRAPLVVGGRRNGLADRHRHVVDRRQGGHRCQRPVGTRCGVRVPRERSDQLPGQVPASRR
jgi:hypothetical protein